MNNKSISKVDSGEIEIFHKKSLQVSNRLLARHKNLLGGISEDWVKELILWADENEIKESVFPRNKQSLMSLEVLDMKGSQIKSLPASLGNLVNLEKLILQSCENLKSLPASLGNLVNLEKLILFNCENLKSLPDSLGDLVNLKKIRLGSYISIVAKT